jgi:cell division protein FtsL
MKKHKSIKLYQEERVWFFAALSMLVVVFSAYVYFLSASVVHVVMRKEINQEIASLGSEISRLEASYIEAQHSVSDEIVSQHGYVVAEEKIFITRTDATLVLSQNNGG